jgi:RNA-directed DNA polymerase
MVEQKMKLFHANDKSRQRNCRGKSLVHQVSITTSTISNASNYQLMEQVVERANMQRAWLRVKGNKGCPGVDGLNIRQTFESLKDEWDKIKQELREGIYNPLPVLQIKIPKASGGTRNLGIPTVKDRLIQQAILQVIQPLFELNFSDSSFGFRPGKSAHMAVMQSQKLIREGRRWVVDIDLEKFFDQVNHDILMAKLARTVQDKRILGLIRRYLQSGILVGGVASVSSKGTPQGGPLSPLLSNIMLDDLDKELEKRGHRFCRYADDCNIYVASLRSGKRVMESISAFIINRLKLKVNEDKSAVSRPWKRKFLGYSFTFNKQSKLKPARDSIARFKSKIKALMRKGRGQNIANFIEKFLNPLIRGWGNYFRYSEIIMPFRKLDRWIRRRLRNLKWRQWKRPVTRFRKLLKRGIPRTIAAKSAYNGRGPWWNSGAKHMNIALPISYFERLNLVSLEKLVDNIEWL